MKKFIGLVLVLLVGLTAGTASAQPEKGWHKGTYYLFGIGMMNNDEDTNVLTNRAFGGNYLLGYGFTTGWNFFDWLALELAFRYATETDNNQKEHAVNININAKYSFILDALTRSELFRFLPYIKAGGGVYGAAVPDTSAGNDRFGVFGPLVGFGGGMEILFKNWLYFGVDIAEDLVFLKEKNNNAGQRILNGGFDPQLSVFGYLGVHL